ncbi:hypothetical protein BSKO_01192 [Bryopsis sp. KO-2023]|nr:hypothetical protein BSKO_01192 [Bryopsis sp. KO-2023]
MENVRRPPSSKELLNATSSFGLDKSVVEVHGDAGQLGDLAAALGKVLRDLQTSCTDGAPETEGGADTPKEIDNGQVVDEDASKVVTGDASGSERGGTGTSLTLGTNGDVDDVSSIDISLSDDDLSLDLPDDDSEPTPAKVVGKDSRTSGLQRQQSSLKRNRGTSGVPVVVFIVGEEQKKLLAHRDIVATRCPYVLASVGWKGDSEGDAVIPLPELTVPGVWACLEFIYTAGFRFEADQVWQVFQAGMFLNLDALTAACANLILENVTDSNAWGVLESGHLLESEVLINAALDRVAERTRLVLASTDFGSASITSAALLKVVKRGDLTIYEKELARAVLSQWVENTSAPKEDVDEVLRHICWPQVYEEDMELLSLAMKKRMLPNDVMAEVLKWVGGPPRGDKIPELMKTRYRNWAFLMTHPRCPPSKYKDVGVPKLSGGKSRWIEVPELPSPFGVHTEGGDHAVVADTYGRLNASKAFSVEAWVKYDEEQNGDFDQCLGAIVSKHGAASGWEIRANREQAQFLVTLRDTRGGQGTAGVWHEVVEVTHNACKDGNSDRTGWFHVAGTFDGQAAAVYVNGINLGMKRIPNFNTRGGEHHFITEDVEVVHFFGHMCIGTNPHWKDRFINADICGVRIYTDRVKTGKQFKGAAES